MPSLPLALEEGQHGFLREECHSTLSALSFASSFCSLDKAPSLANWLVGKAAEPSFSLFVLPEVSIELGGVSFTWNVIGSHITAGITGGICVRAIIIINCCLKGVLDSATCI